MYKLVLIDDDELLIKGIQKHINLEALEITLTGSANNGAAGFELIKETKPDIVISDIDMPELNGIELLQKIEKLEHVPLVILLTGLDSFEYAKKAVFHNAFAYLTKPAFPPEITDILKHTVSHLAIKTLYDQYLFQNSIMQNNKHDALICLNTLINNVYSLKIYEIDLLQRSIFLFLKSYMLTFFKITDEDFYENLRETISFIKEKNELGDFVNKTISHHEAALSEKITTSSKIVDSIKHYVDENYSDSDLSVQKLAAIFNISPNYLRTVFKEKYSISYKDYLIKTRMENAKLFLDSCNYKVYEVSNIVGYKNVHQFRKQYKDYFGFTPSIQQFK